LKIGGIDAMPCHPASLNISSGSAGGFICFLRIGFDTNKTSEQHEI
jgi:hypothetical protein